MFENGQIVEKFLDYWRKSGNQRLGYLIGRYEPFEGAPLGIKAVVSAIYEPPQVRKEDHRLLDLLRIVKPKFQFDRNLLTAVSI